MNEYSYSILYVIIAGIFGGLLYAVQDKKIILPFIKYSIQEDKITHRNTRKCETVELGIIADLLFGAGGGLLIFLITPAAPEPKETMGIIKLLSLSIAGGYGGQVLVKKISNKNMEELGSKTEELGSKTKELDEKTKDLLIKIDDANKCLSKIEGIKANDQKVYKMFYEIIDGSPFEIEEIREALKGVSQSIKLRGFTLLDDRRKELVSKLLENQNAPEEKMQSIKGEFERLIPLLREIIVSEEHYNANDINFYLNYQYASLAYMYKDRNNPDWTDALEFINKAIEIHGKKHKKIDIPETYILNKLLCHINKEEKEESNSCFKRLWELPGGRYELIRSSPILAPNLHKWISKNYPDEIKDLFLKNENYCEYKRNWRELFPENKEFRGC